MQLQLKKIFGEKNSDLEKQAVLMSKWNLIHYLEKLMMLLKMCITKGINFRTEDTKQQQDLTEVEEEVEATEGEFRKDTRIQLILMVTFPDIEFVNPSIIGKTIALITPTESPKVRQELCFTNPCFILKNHCNKLRERL